MNSSNVTPLDKIDFEKFLKEELTVSENRNYTKKVDDRFIEIVESIFKGYAYDVIQFDYNVDPYEDDVDEGCNSFDVELFKENVAFYAKVAPSNNSTVLPTSFISLYQQFPTSWFYSDFKDELLKIISQDTDSYVKYKHEQEQKKLTEAKKVEGYEEDVKNAKLKILNILPPELLKYISFVSAENLESNIKKQEIDKKKLREKKIKKLKGEGFDIKANYKKIVESNSGQTFENWIDSLD